MLKPMPGFVLGEVLKEKEESIGGVYLPDNVQDKPARAKVLVVGAPLEHFKRGDETAFQSSKTSVKEGQTIIHKRWQPTAIKDAGKELVFIAFEDILGVYDDN